MRDFAKPNAKQERSAVHHTRVSREAHTLKPTHQTAQTTSGVHHGAESQCPPAETRRGARSACQTMPSLRCAVACTAGPSPHTGGARSELVLGLGALGPVLGVLLGERVGHLGVLLDVLGEALRAAMVGRVQGTEGSGWVWDGPTAPCLSRTRNHLTFSVRSPSYVSTSLPPAGMKKMEGKPCTSNLGCSFSVPSILAITTLSTCTPPPRTHVQAAERTCWSPPQTGPAAEPRARQSIPRTVPTFLKRLASFL